jgi:hypothetical protein
VASEQRDLGKLDAVQRHEAAEALLATIFKRAGWQVRRHPSNDADRDLVVRRKGFEYVAEVKAATEGRADRLVPLFAQALLESLRVAGGKAAPLVVVAAPRISARVAEQVMKFAELHAPDGGAGVIDFAGLAMFRGPHLESLDAPGRIPRASRKRTMGDAGHLFSDLNQWMLKVLLAPEIPDALLSAPRARYRNASQLAQAANVSLMSAFRFLQLLEREGHLHESSPHLRLVRRDRLFARWQAATDRARRELSMRFVLPGDRRAHLRKMLGRGRGCLALFAAAEALDLGFVSGVPPYVYVPRVQPSDLAAWKDLRPSEAGESPDVIVRQAPAPQSVFRGVVRPGGVESCDVLQIWLDVAGHPSRGREQADLIRKRVLQAVIQGES